MYAGPVRVLGILSLLSHDHRIKTTHCDYNASLFVLSRSSVHEATSKNVTEHTTGFRLIFTYGSHPLKMDVHS